MMIFAGCMPFILGAAPVAPWVYAEMTGGLPTSAGPWGREHLEVILASLVGMAFYALAGAGLAVASVMGFDRAADRPFRDEFAPRPPGPAPEVSAPTKTAGDHLA